MDFNKFQTEFLTQLKSKNKKCLESIESNKTLIQENLGENADAEVIKNFVKELNEVIVENVENDDHQINIIIEEEIQKYIIPYANNYYPEYSSRSSMESDKKLIYKRNETKGMSTKFILFEVGEFLLRFGIIILVIYLLKFLF
ncbi:hypothetical protein H8356DRAFT_1302019 [Neocallimastix lanati (nom. inval.)]|nr:hypothetical protein H8356DRAFT_1302019 [Neocallimastix sp. JGI-2020a]